MYRQVSMIIVPLLFASMTVYAASEDETALAKVLACHIDADDFALVKTAAILKARSTRDSDDGWQISGRVQAGRVCLDNVKVAAAFGVFMAIGSVCEGESQSIVDFVNSTKRDLKPAAIPLQPGMMEAFDAPDYSFVLYRGEPNMPFVPDPSSQHISYVCTYRFSDAR